MARIYSDEHFPRIVSEFLRTVGHDVLTVQEAGNANQGIPDPEVLEFAASNDRAVLTLNHFDFIGLHKQQQNHAGIIVCKDDRDRNRLAIRINEAISTE